MFLWQGTGWWLGVKHRCSRHGDDNKSPNTNSPRYCQCCLCGHIFLVASVECTHAGFSSVCVFFVSHTCFYLSRRLSVLKCTYSWFTVCNDWPGLPQKYWMLKCANIIHKSVWAGFAGLGWCAHVLTSLILSHSSDWLLPLCVTAESLLPKLSTTESYEWLTIKITAMYCKCYFSLWLNWSIILLKLNNKIWNTIKLKARRYPIQLGRTRTKRKTGSFQIHLFQKRVSVVSHSSYQVDLHQGSFLSH